MERISLIQHAQNNIFGKKSHSAGAVRRAPQRHNHSLGQSSGVRGKSQLGLSSGSKFFRKVTRTAMACGWMGSGILPKIWEDRSGKVFGLFWTRGTACACARRPPSGTFREVWAAWRALFLPHTEGAVVASNEVLPNPYVCAETLKACALIGLHLFGSRG